MSLIISKHSIIYDIWKYSHIAYRYSFLLIEIVSNKLKEK